MKSLEELYSMAEEMGIDVYDYHFENMRSVSIPGAIGMDLSQMETTADEKTDLGHEMGHEATASFYNEHTGADDKGKCERKANKYAAEHLLLPLDELVEAMRDGIREPWQIAEHFGVTEEFVNIAIGIYSEKLQDALQTVKNVQIVQDGNGYSVPEMRMHITTTRSASPKDIRKAVEIIQRLQAKDYEGIDTP